MRIKEGFCMVEMHSRLFSAMFYVLLFLAVVGLCGCGGGGGSTPAVQKEITSITVTPSSPTIAAGASQQLVATGTFSDSTTEILTNQVSWSSSASSIASIAQDGLATAVAVGSATMSATLNGKTGAVTLNVIPVLISIAISPATATIVAGASQDFTATGTYSDGSTQDLTDQVTWSSTVDSNSISILNGIYTISAGSSSIITAELDGISGTATLTVTPPP